MFDQFPAHVREAYQTFCAAKEAESEAREKAAFEAGKAAGRDEVLSGLKALSAFLPAGLQSNVGLAPLPVPAGLDVCSRDD